MTTTAQMLEQVSQQLENRSAYTPDEQCRTGLNPAFALVCLLSPMVLTQHSVITITARTMLLDLQVSFPRCIAVQRVFLGQNVTDRPGETAGHFVPLRRTTREQLARRDPQWLTRQAEPRYWYLLGRQQLGWYPRPLVDMTITVSGYALPVEVRATELDAAVGLDAIQHPLVVDLAQQLLMVKQGAGEAERGFQQLQALLQTTALDEPLRRLRRLQQQATPPA